MKSYELMKILYRKHGFSNFRNWNIRIIGYWKEIAKIKQTELKNHGRIVNPVEDSRV